MGVKESIPLRCRYIAATVIGGNQLMLQTIEQKINEFLDDLAGEVVQVVAMPPFGVLVFYRINEVQLGDRHQPSSS